MFVSYLNKGVKLADDKLTSMELTGEDKVRNILCVRNKGTPKTKLN